MTRGFLLVKREKIQGIFWEFWREGAVKCGIQSLPCVKGGGTAQAVTEGLTRECLHFLFNSEKKVRKKTPRETHGFTTSFSALRCSEQWRYSSRKYLRRKLRLNVASTLLLTRSAAHCIGNVETGATNSYLRIVHCEFLSPVLYYFQENQRRCRP